MSAREAGQQIEALYADARRCAAAAGLTYVDVDAPATTRRRHGKGFTYRDSHGRPIADPARKRRIAALVIPPAWNDVWISENSHGHILAVGNDDRGRRQYIYHDRWRELRDRLNFYRLITFAEHLPAVRRHVDTQLRRRTVDRDRVLAVMVRLIDLTAIRIGGETYADENDSYGLSTLTKRHVSVRGASITLDFPAKSGKRATLSVTDRPIAAVLAELAGRRGRRLFTVDSTPIDAAAVNELLTDITGTHVTAKDFRTWLGTSTAFAHLDRRAPPADPAAREHLAIEAVDAAADRLGNTRTVAREHYVHPAVTHSYVEDGFGELWPRRTPRGPVGLDRSERRLTAFLINALTVELAGPLAWLDRSPSAEV